MELVRSFDKLSTQKIGNIIMNNLIYGIMRKEEIRRPQKLAKNPLNPNKNNIFHKIKVPFLPSPEDDDSYTLVLDLDETLIHFFYVNNLYNIIDPFWRDLFHQTRSIRIPTILE